MCCLLSHQLLLETKGLEPGYFSSDLAHDL